MKSRTLIITFATVLLTLLLSSAISAQPKSKTWIKGTWEGTGYQIDNQSTWTMLFTARSRKFSIDYISRDDLAALTRESAEVSGIQHVMDVDRAAVEEILAGA